MRPRYESARDRENAAQIAERSGVPLMVVTKWADNLGYLRVRDPHRYPVKTGGRTDRGDEQDIEALYDIPIGKFRLFPERAHG